MATAKNKAAKTINATQTWLLIFDVETFIGRSDSTTSAGKTADRSSGLWMPLKPFRRRAPFVPFGI